MQQFFENAQNPCMHRWQARICEANSAAGGRRVFAKQIAPQGACPLYRQKNTTVYVSKSQSTIPPDTVPRPIDIKEKHIAKKYTFYCEFLLLPQLIIRRLIARFHINFAFAHKITYFSIGHFMGKMAE